MPVAVWAQVDLRTAPAISDLPADAAFAALGFLLRLAAVCAGAVAAVLLGLRNAPPQPGSAALAAAFACAAACGLLVAAADAGIAGVSGGRAHQGFWIAARLAEAAGLAAVLLPSRTRRAWPVRRLAGVAALLAAAAAAEGMGPAALGIVAPGVAAALRLGACLLLLGMAAQRIGRAAPAGVDDHPIGAHLVHAVVFQVVLDPQKTWRVTYVSPAIERLHGLRAADLYKALEPWFAQIVPHDWPRFVAQRDAALRDGTSLDVELQMRRADGELRWMRISAGGSRVDDGSVVVEGLVFDVTQRRQAEQQVHQKDEEWQAVLSHIPGDITRIDRALRVRYMNENHARWYGGRAADFVGKPFLEVIPAVRYAQMQPYLARALAGERVVYEADVALANGEMRRRHSTLVPEHDVRGAVTGAVLYVVDVTEHRQAEQALAHKESQLRSLFEAIPDMVFSKDRNGRYLSCNQAFESFYGWREEEILGQGDDGLVGPAFAAMFREQDRRVMDTGQPLRGEEPMHTLRHHREGIFDLIKTPLRDADGEVYGVLGVARDVTERKRAQRDIERLAYYDSLTGLPNRRRLAVRLGQALLPEAIASAGHGALLSINLDHFKNINDTLGPEVGDQLLRAASERMTGVVPVHQTVARQSGDEFAVLLEALANDAAGAQAEAEQIARELLAALAAPLALGGRQHHGTARIGIALFGGPPVAPEELLTRASLACDEARSAGRNTVRFFDPAMQKCLAERAALQADLHDAVGEGQLALHYQPVVRHDGSLTGAEALLRWQHPVRGTVPPAGFIGLAEETGLILPIGNWVLQEACVQLVAWAAHPGTQGLDIAVNVSARQFRHPDFIDETEAILARTGADPRRLKLELTESLLFHDTEEVLTKLARLKARGIGLSLDDFGTGFSSLGYLKRMPLDQLKIDRSFVRDVLTDPNDAAIVRTILALAASLDLHVVAEGVETEGQRDFLQAHGCRAFQGYLFGKPMPMAEFERAQGLDG
ncbi:EAL domain-containing protein [Sphingomonas sp. NCPPB 2930]